MKKLALAIIVSLLAIASVSAAVISSPAATVYLIKNTVITTDQLNAEVEKYKAMGAGEVNPVDVLNLMINDEVFLQGAERDGVNISDSYVDLLYAQQKVSIEQQAGQSITESQFQEMINQQFGSVDAYRQYLKENAVVSAYLQMKKANEVSNYKQPTASEINSFYRKNSSMWVQPEYVEFAHIYKEKSDSQSENNAKKAELEKASKEITSGAISFEEAVSKYSDDKESAANGGYLGYLTADNTTARTGWGDDFCDELLSTEPGTITGVMESLTGYHIVSIISHENTRILSLDDRITPDTDTTVREYIQYILTQQNAETAYNNALSSLVAELRNQARINIIYKEK